ncbi:MAG: hypothetical protein ACT4PU_06915 [Planctomycetota bacterium]
MRALLRSPVLSRLRSLAGNGEILLLLLAVAIIELAGPRATDDVDAVLLVLLLPGLFLVGCSLLRRRSLPLTSGLLETVLGAVQRLRGRLVLSLGLDFHPQRHPRLPAFTTLRRAVITALLAAVVLLPADGLLRDLLLALRRPGLYTAHVLLLGAVWVLLLTGILVQTPAILLGLLEVIKGRTRLRGLWRASRVAGGLVLLTLLLMALHRAAGIQGCLAALGFAAVLPTVLRAVDPPGAPWLNIAFGKDSRPRTAPVGELIRDTHRLLALLALLVVALLAPPRAAAGELSATPLTDLLVAVYGWSAAWLFTGGMVLATAEFNRRRRLFDPAFERSRVLWAAPGPEGGSLQAEHLAIERAGWRLIVSESMPSAEDADLLVGIPAGLMPPCPVPLARVPAALFLLAPDPALVLDEADERDKGRRAIAAIERLLAAARPRFGDRGEGTFLVPQCWMVVGLTRDDDRSEGDRPPAMTYGQSYQSVLGTRLRRFLHEVMARAGIDVFYIEDAVTAQQVRDVLERLVERHVRRTEPAAVAEQDFLGVQGVHIVLHDVTPESEGIRGVDSPLAHNAISRARILIISRDRRDGGDDDEPPVVDESSDGWLREALRRLFPRLQPI